MAGFVRTTWAVVALLAGVAVPVIVTPGIAAAQVSTAQDLASVIALNGRPCGTVAQYEKRAENDWNVTCSGGQRYRVYVDASGRVKVDPRR